MYEPKVKNVPRKMRIRQNKNKLLALLVCAVMISGVAAAIISNQLAGTWTLVSETPLSIAWVDDVTPFSDQCIVGIAYVASIEVSNLNTIEYTAGFRITIGGPVGFDALDFVMLINGVATSFVPDMGNQVDMFNLPAIAAGATAIHEISMKFNSGAPMGAYTFAIICET